MATPSRLDVDSLKHYRTIEKIGAGGMGEVYRAHDLRLGRDVAIKVLSSACTRDASTLRRFEQEARLAASLNHPNILVVHDINTAAECPFIVSEFLQGETLRMRLRRGPLPLRKVVEYGTQIASGLAAAHEQGILHRDLKPENIFLTREGRAKILDFGLAKLTPGDESPAQEQVTALTSEHNAIIGTVGYMSPEQLRGKPVDARSDLFALGAVLYEMISGRRAFEGDSSADITSAILNVDPPDLNTPNADVPPVLAQIIFRCLEKDPANRFQSARDLIFDLEVVVTASSSAIKPAPIPFTATPRIVAALLIALILVAGVAGWFAFHTAKLAEPNMQRLTYRRGALRAARFAPDGETVIYGAEWDGAPVRLFTTRAESKDSRPLEYADAQILSVSRRGDMAVSLHTATLGPFLTTGTLAQVSLAGAAPREQVENVNWADWDPDGKTVAVLRGIGGSYPFRRNRLEYPPGNVLYTPEAWASHIRVSPDGRTLAFLEHVAGGDDGWVVTVDKSGGTHRLTQQFSSIAGLAWSPDGKEIWFAAAKTGFARALYAVTLTGKQRLVMRVAGTLTLQDISRSGRVLLTHESARMGVKVSSPATSGETELSWFEWSYVDDLSHDGKTVIITESGEGAGPTWGVFLRHTDGSPAVRLGDGSNGALTQDGRWVLATSAETPSQVVLLPTGAGQVQRLTHDNLSHDSIAWAGSEDHIVFVGREPGHRARSYVLDRASGVSKPVTPEGVIGTCVSPDGRSLAAVDEDGKLWLYALDGSDRKAIPGVEAGEEALAWAQDSDRLYVRRRAGVPARIYLLNVRSGQRQLSRTLLPSDPTGVLDLPAIVLSSDAESYAYSYSQSLADLYVVDGLR